MWPGLTLQIHDVILDVHAGICGGRVGPSVEKGSTATRLSTSALGKNPGVSAGPAPVQTRLLTSGVLLHAVKQIRLMCCRSAKQTV